jgi:hypothetical protein
MGHRALPLAVIGTLVVAALGIAPSRPSAQTATPQASPPAEAGNVFYRADASGGFEAWPQKDAWTLRDGVLFNDGTNRFPARFLVAPYDPGATTDYAVEAEIQVGGAVSDDAVEGERRRDRRQAVETQVAVPTESSCSTSTFGVVVRADASSKRGYWSGLWYGGDHAEAAFIASAVADRCHNPFPASFLALTTDFPLDPDGHPHWHTFRVEVRGKRVWLLVDGRQVAEAIDPFVPSGGGQVGLWSQAVPLSVRSFTVIAL